ncbi:wax ester/triacylglycerol synthase family O-acyltransferase [Amycolatopsis anabasis]|uniref:wax ester/triacylglycerol synthase family O-acyltransferase n=1 Tax=Amycolatopsis anabasis TaxID=1840409 RepID=UPI00131BE2C6|nr:wax ester/triacylglycerol synthase family O-acyltransferase [Amycolatopsis anabasis]
MTGTQLSGLDVAFLCLESESSPMHMGAVVTFRPRRPVDPDRLAALLAERAARTPRLRRQVRPTIFPPGGAMWTEDPAFDAREHIHVHRLTDLYESEPLAEYAAEWIEQPLDTGRPLWDAHVVTGLPGDRFALLLKLHHALTDGAGAFAVACGLLDETAVTRRAAAAEARTEGRAASPLAALRAGVSAAISEAGENAGIASAVLRAARPYPVSPLSAPNSPSRRLGFVRLDLADVRRIRGAHGGTANDVLLAVLSGALREWLLNRGRRVDDRPLRALVPVSLRGREGNRAANQLSGYLCELPVHVDDPVERLRAVRRSMNRSKAAGSSAGAGAIPILADRLPPAVHRVATRFAGQAAGLLFDTVITNVPLPSVPLALDGAPLREVYPLVPLAPRHAVGIAVSIYRDWVHIGLQANGEEVPDLGSLRDGVVKSVAALHDRCP